MKIIHAKSDQEMDQARELFREYESFLGVSLDFQDFQTELAGLPGKYAHPDGALFLAMNHGRVIGCGALRRLGPKEKNRCEMKRLFLRPDARGHGTGKKLALRIIEEAVFLGYSAMFLDTLHRLSEAMTLYEGIGFVQTPPYYDNPMPDVVYWTLDLGGN